MPRLSDLLLNSLARPSKGEISFPDLMAPVLLPPYFDYSASTDTMDPGFDCQIDP